MPRVLLYTNTTTKPRDLREVPQSEVHYVPAWRPRGPAPRPQTACRRLYVEDILPIWVRLL